MADERELQQQRLEAELAECVMSSSWFYCVAGVALAVPLGVRRKSYMPVVVAGVVGTLMDLLSGYDKCKAQRQALEGYLLQSRGGAKAALGATAKALGQEHAATADGPKLERELDSDGGGGGGT